MPNKTDAIAFMEKMIKKHTMDHLREFERGASEGILLNIHNKIICYKIALAALKEVGDCDGNL
jgi:hypothetical protein